MEPLKPLDLRLGNFVECLGAVEMVTGLIQTGENTWYVCHKAWNQQTNPIPEGVLYSAYGIILSDDWKVCLKIDKVQLPDWIMYVHEAQNYMRWHSRVELIDHMDWDLFGKLI